MPTGPSKGIASLLAMTPIVGWIGMDKLYIYLAGNSLSKIYISFFVIQLFLSITIYGLYLTIPISYISAGILLFSIVLSSYVPLLPSPGKEWKQNPVLDYGALAIAILILICRIIYYYLHEDNDDEIDESKIWELKICKKTQNYFF